MTTLVRDPDFTLYQGDALDVLVDIDDESVHCVVTSPPYWGLRDYGISGQLGLEPTPEAYLARMIEVFREVRRVLRRDGTCWVNMGDSYASVGERVHGGFNGSTPTPQRTKGERLGAPMILTGSGIKPKDLVGMPWRLAFALQADGWYLRADVIWSKPNPMPESVTDRPTKSHEYVFLLTRSPRYYFDQEAVREPHVGPLHAPGNNAKRFDPQGRSDGHHWNIERMDQVWGNPNGRNIRSVWEIPTQPYSEAHFATYPEALVERCLKAGTSERGCCPECGMPWEREVEHTPIQRYVTGKTAERQAANASVNDARTALSGAIGPKSPMVITLGWRPGCSHDHQPIPCTVLDPFLGSGTTAHVARRLGRRSIGVELNPDYCQLAARRMQQQTLFA